MKKIILPVFLLSIGVSAQNISKEEVKNLNEVKIKTIKRQKIRTDVKLACSVDEYLSSSENISFIKKGAYAWEPLLNNMNTERSSVTIEGMHVFGACTDKMDPVTSYVETNNLSSVDIQSGQEGTMHGATIAGAIDLKRRRVSFSDEPKIGGSYQTGIETNNKQFFNLGDLYFSNEEWVVDGTISYRKTDDYKAGNSIEVPHSQYKKFNTSFGVGYKMGPLSSIKLDAIFDLAKDVGYPALPMDAWLARALITSANYKQLYEEGLLRVWDTKFYFNAVEHYMDDTTRPENRVHMDMPGWSTTYGLTSKLHLRRFSYSADVQWNSYTNESTAEMTTYPQTYGNPLMFAYTWPVVTTNYAGISINNQLELTDNQSITFGGALNLHQNKAKYMDFVWIFHPGSPNERTRFLPNLFGSYTLRINPISITAGLGYGHRAPSVSEGYGYYIFNSFDRYDYIGNPNLKNEISYEANLSASVATKKLVIEAKTNYFHIKNYIIGKILNIGYPMNILSVGVKGYTALDYAKILNISLNFKYDINDYLNWKGMLSYAKGQDWNNENLPFIRPFSYQTTLKYRKNKFSCQASINGDFTQVAYSPEYGEDRTPAYIIYNLSADYTFKLRGRSNLQLQAGVENLADTYYSTYADWGNIPRMGRNVFLGAKVMF